MIKFFLNGIFCMTSILIKLWLALHEKILTKNYNIVSADLNSAVSAAPTCRKEQTREYYSENGCRSRKPVKMAKCEGSCGTSCCRARKTKRRKVRLICNDGTRYTKDVEIVRKCACTKKCY